MRMVEGMSKPNAGLVTCDLVCGDLGFGLLDDGRAINELRVVVGEHGVGPARYGGDQGLQEVGSNAPGSLLVQLDEDEAGCPGDGNKQIETFLLGVHLGAVDVEGDNRTALEAQLRGFGAVHLG